MKKIILYLKKLITDDIRNIRKAIKNQEALDERGQQRKACLIGCVFHKTRKPGQEISSIITDAITRGTYC